jgi:hypothetical protein
VRKGRFWRTVAINLNLRKLILVINENRDIQKEKDVFDPYQIKIEQAPVIQGYPGLIVTLPVPLREI